MRVKSALGVGLAGALLAGCGLTSNHAPEPQTVVPLRIANLSGALLPVVSVNVAAGPDINVILDTGSAGLRVKRGSIGNNGIALSTEPITQIFADGTTFFGVKATAPVTIATTLKTPPIAIQLIESINCDHTIPTSTCAHNSEISGLGGIDGVLGIGLVPNDSVSSPLLQLNPAPSRYQLTLSNPPALTLGALPSSPRLEFELTRVQTPDGTRSYPNGIPYLDDRHVSACWTFRSPEVSCVPTLFDTGTNNMIVGTDVAGVPPGKAGQLLSTGSGRLSLMNSEADSKGIWSLRAGDIDSGNQIYLQNPSAGLSNPPDVIAGHPFWKDMTVGYDLAKGMLTVATS